MIHATAVAQRIGAAVAFYAGALVAALAWIEIEPALAWRAGYVSALHLAHVVQLGSIAALVVSAAAGAFLLAQRALVARGARLAATLVPLLVAATIAPFALSAGRMLGAGDGVPRDLAGTVTAAATVTLAGVPAIVFHWWTAETRSLRWAASGAVVWVLMAIPAAHMLATYAFLAPFVLGVATFAGAAVIAAAIGTRTGARLVTTAVVGTTVAGAWLGALPRGALGTQARRAFLMAESSATGLDVLLFGALPGRAFARFETGGAGPPRCTAQKRVPWPPLRVAGEKRRNVILISIDGLRRDAVRWTFGGQAVAPHIARFMQDGVTPERAYTSYPATLFALAGAATGLAPSRLLAARRQAPGLFRLLQGRVDERHAVLPGTGWFRAPAIDLAVTQGAGAVFTRNTITATDTMIDRLTRARTARKSVFAWVHYGEPHVPYRKRKDHAFGRGLRRRYASEVAHTDHQVGRLLAHLAHAGWYEDSLVMLFADHGEALRERGLVGHHVSLNRWVMDVPLAFSAPPDARPKRKPKVASVLDVAPTALHFLGVDPPRYPLDGRSLLAPEPRARHRPIVAEAFPLRGNDLWALVDAPVTSRADVDERLRRVESPAAHYAPKVAMVWGDRRLIVHRASGLVELYDTRRDRKERFDRSEVNPATTHALLSALAKWHREAARRMHCEQTQP